MTNEELFTDLKQFIEATVSQQTAHLDGRIDTVERQVKDVEQQINYVECRLKVHIHHLDQKLDQVQEGVADTLTHVAETIDTTLQDHEQRLCRLEHKAA